MTNLTILLTDLSGTQAGIFVVSALLISVVVKLFFFRKSKKESPFSELGRKFSSGEINAFQFEQLQRELQKEEDLKTKSFFLSRV